MLQRFFVRKIVSPLNSFVYKLSGGRLMAKMNDLPVLLLVTTGRKSGKARTAPLLYTEDNDALVVLASFAGQPEHPAWYLNLEANPNARVRLGGEEHAVRAETVEGDERERLWKQMTAGYAGFGSYQEKTTREIPVVLLQRT